MLWRNSTDSQIDNILLECRQDLTRKHLTQKREQVKALVDPAGKGRQCDRLERVNAALARFADGAREWLKDREKNGELVRAEEKKLAVEYDPLGGANYQARPVRTTFGR